MISGHGNDIYAYPQLPLADFSTNVWQGAQAHGLKEHLVERWDLTQRYPDPEARLLAQRIANFHGLPSEQVLIHNGSTESIYQIGRAFSGHDSCIVVPAFAEYEDSCRLAGHRLLYLSFDEACAHPSCERGLVWIGHPGNPTGQLLPGLEDWIGACPNAVFILDEAFIEFTAAERRPETPRWLSKYKNLIILRSLTKSFAIPGLRLGYVLTHSLLAARIRKYTIPWSVGALAQEAGHFIFKNYEELLPPLETLLAEKLRFVAKLEKTGLLSILPSEVHYFLAELSIPGTALQLKSWLMKEHRILIRDASNFRGLSAAHLRLATLSASWQDILIAALLQWQWL